MANFLKKILNFGGGGSGGSVIGVDIGSSSIKIVQLRKVRGVAMLETYGALALGPYGNTEMGRAVNLTTERLSEALSTLIREAKVTSQDAGIAIPFGASLMPLIEMPALGEKELARMIPIEARKYIPVPIAEVEFDWWIVPKREQFTFGQGPGQPQSPPIPETVPTPQAQQLNARAVQKKVDVLIVAIHKDTISKFIQVTQKAGLQPSFFEIEVFSTVRATIEQSIEPVMVCDIGAAATKLYVVEHGIVRASHIVNKGSQDITLMMAQAGGLPIARAEEKKRLEGMLGQSANAQNNAALMQNTLQFIFSEIGRIVNTYERKHNTVVSKILFTGGGSVLGGLLPYAQNAFQTPVELADPFAKVDTPAFAQDILKTTGPEFSVALGLALRRLQEIDQE